MNSLKVWIPPAPLCSAFQSQDCAASLPGKIIYVIASVWQILAIPSWKLIISYFSLLSPLSRALHGKSSTPHPVMKDNFPTLAELTSFYNHLTLHIVAGPRSFSYFIPLLLLPISLLIPPPVLSHNALRSLILPSASASRPVRGYVTAASTSSPRTASSGPSRCWATTT